MAQITAVSSSSVIKSAGGRLFGVVIGSASSGTIKLWDNTSGAGRVLIDTTTAVSAPLNLPLPEPVTFVTGLYITIGGSATVSVIWD